MTVEALKPADAAEDRLRSRALDAIRTCTLEVILNSDEPLRTVDAARAVAEHLGLALNEEELGGLSSVVRMVLDSDPLFSQSNRQWDLALRMGRAEGDRRKPVERAIEDFIDLLGRPSRPHPVAVLVSSVYGRDSAYYEAMIERLAPTRPQFFPARDGRFGITRWLIDISSDEPEDVEYDNFDDTTVLNALREVARAASGEGPTEFAIDVVRRAGDPVENRALLFLTWSKFPDIDPDELFVDLFASPEVVLERGPVWVTAESHQQVLEEIRTLSANPETATDLVAATVPAEDEDTGILAPTTVRVSDEDLEQVYDFMAQNERSYRVSELCQQALESFPGSRTYPGVVASLTSRMREDERFQWVGFERFRLQGTVPPEVELLPEGLAFDEGEYLGEEGAEVDKVLDPREWKHGLEEQVQHYLVQDVGDDSTAPQANPAARLEVSPPLHHYVAGTRYLRNSDRGFFPVEPELVQVTLSAPDGSRFEAWVNNRLGLLYGLKEWYDANLPWVGGKFTIEHGSQQDEYVLNYSGEVEPLMDISTERLQQLLPLRGEAASEMLPLTEIVLRLLRAYPDGVHFVTLFTEVNVVRRVRRAQLASILSGQRYFQQVQGQPGLWHYDEKRAQKSKKKGGPKRPMREYYDEDEGDEFLEE